MFGFRTKSSANNTATATGPVVAPIPPGVQLVSLRDLEKVFETPAGKMYVLRRITFDIAPGEFVSIMGPSGAGKSTLLAILGMLDHHWHGEYWLLGAPVPPMNAKQPAALNQHPLRLVFPQYHLIDDLTRFANLDIPLSY